MSDHNGTPEPRPRPKYGELAPEGWTWTPPSDVERLDTARPLRPALPPVEPGAAFDADSSIAYAGGAHRVAPWNRSATLLLIAIGFMGMLISVEWLGAFPQQIQIFYTTQGLGTYHPAPSVAGILLAGQITQAGIWVISTVLSAILLAHKRSSVYVPVLAGILAAIMLFVFMSAALATDSTLINYYSSL